MRSLILSLALITTSLALAQKEAAVSQDTAAKAQAILAQSRAALGSEAKWKALNGLAITGSYQRQMGQMGNNMQQTGEWQLDLLMPDKVLLSETFSPMSGVDVTRLQALNGEQVWMDTQNNGGGGHLILYEHTPHHCKSRFMAEEAQDEKNLLVV